MKYINKAFKHKTVIFLFLAIEVVIYTAMTIYTHRVMDNYVVDKSYFYEYRSAIWFCYVAISCVVALLFINYKSKKQSLIDRKFKTILDAQDNMIIITDGKEIVDTNERVLDFFGFNSYEDMKKQSNCISKFFIEHDNFFHLGRIKDGQNWVEVLPTLPEQQRVVNIVGYNMVAHAFKVKVNKYSEFGYFVISFNDITNILAEQERLKYQALHDNLTGIFNRQKLDDALSKLCKFNSRRKEKVSIILLDIDYFKIINDTYGHVMGDNVLKILAKLVKDNIRENDIFGRWGGEEFILIMRHATLDEAYKKAQRLRLLIEQLDIENLPKITASFGVAALDSYDTPDSVFRKVDLALYEAKDEGRNRVVITESILEPV